MAVAPASLRTDNEAISFGFKLLKLSSSTGTPSIINRGSVFPVNESVTPLKLMTLSPPGCPFPVVICSAPPLVLEVFGQRMHSVVTRWSLRSYCRCMRCWTLLWRLFCKLPLQFLPVRCPGFNVKLMVLELLTVYILAFIAYIAKV